MFADARNAFGAIALVADFDRPPTPSLGACSTSTGATFILRSGATSGEDFGPSPIPGQRETPPLLPRTLPGAGYALIRDFRLFA
jgi:hypothetical protein